MAFYVYILQSETTGKTYVGQTSDLARRVRQHNDPSYTLTKHTKRNAGPWQLFHCEEYPNRSKAMKREKQLKTGSGREWIRDNFLGLKSE